jgi:hypothetical protein
MQLAAGAVAQVFANEFERGHRIRNRLLGVRTQYLHNVFVGNLRSYG